MKQLNYRIEIATFFTLSFLTAALPPTATATSLEELLVEKGVISVNEAAQIANKDPSHPPRFTWDKGIKFEDPKSQFVGTLYLRYKGSYSYTRNDKDANRSDVSSFTTQDFWLGSSGSLLNREIKYKLEANMAGTSSERLRDAYLEWVGNPLTEIRFGHSKTPISRAFNASSFSLQFPTNPIVSDLVHFDRQNGLGWRAKMAEEKLTIGASITNGGSSGEGRVVPGNDTKHAGFVFSRLSLLGKINDMEEGDYYNSPDPAISFGSAYGHSTGRLNDEVLNLTDSVASNAISFDANYKYRGHSVHSEFFWRENDYRDNTDGAVLGFYVQSGYFLIPSKLEFAGRYTYADCDEGKYGSKCKGSEDLDQVSAVLNYFIWGYSLRAQLGYDYLRERRLAPTESNYGTHKIGLTLVGGW